MEIQSNCVITFVSLYGLLWQISSSEIMEPLYIIWVSVLEEFLIAIYTTHCNLLPIIVNDYSIEFKLYTFIPDITLPICRELFSLCYAHVDCFLVCGRV